MFKTILKWNDQKQTVATMIPKKIKSIRKNMNTMGENDLPNVSKTFFIHFVP